MPILEKEMPEFFDKIKAGESTQEDSTFIMGPQFLKRVFEAEQQET